MATLTTSYQLLGSVKTSTYSQLRLYGKYNSQSTDNNTSSVSLQLRLYGNGGKGSFSSGTAKISGTSYSLGNTSYSKNAEKTLCTKTYTATHSSDGTYTASISYSISTTGTVSGSSSASITLPQIKRTSVLSSVSNFTFGNSITINFTKYVSSYTQNLNVIIDGSTVKTVTGISSGNSISFSSGELTAAYAKIPSATSATVTFQLVTLNGSTQVGTSSQTATGTIPSSVKPTISSVTLNDAMGYYSTVGSYVYSKSKIHGVINASAGSGSSISSYSTSINSQTLTGSTFTTSVLSTTGTNTYTTTVTDARGRTATYSGTFNVIAYSPPAINTFTIVRCDSSGTQDDSGNYVKINISAKITSLNSTNSKSYVLSYKLSSASTYTTLISDATSYTYTLTDSVQSGFSSSNSYDFKLVVTDSYGSTTQSINIPTASVVMDFYNDGTGVAIGKVAETPNKFDVAYDTQVNGEVVVDSIRSKNMLNLESWGTQTINGITFTNNGNGSITINGTATQDSGVNFVLFKIKAGNYYLSINESSTLPNVFYLYDHDSNVGFGNGAITLSQDYNKMGFDTWITNGTSFNNITISPQLETGSTATTYAPYQNLNPNIIKLDMMDDTSGSTWQNMMKNKIDYCINNINTTKGDIETFINGGWYGRNYGFGVFSKLGNVYQLVWFSSDGIYYCRKLGDSTYNYRNILWTNS